ncbi:fructokinase-1-like, partial [Trifolium medium]|nr:fructokinase-1-like [Trifolium medium]
MGLKGSILIATSSIVCAPAFKVNIVDSVGFGDSFVVAFAYGFDDFSPGLLLSVVDCAVEVGTSIF